MPREIYDIIDAECLSNETDQRDELAQYADDLAELD